jgi:rhamnulokinase
MSRVRVAAVRLGTELTDASTTGLLDTRVLKWADQVGEALAVPIKMVPRLRAAGEVAGPSLPDLGLAGPPQVNLGPSHDTAAAARVPTADGASPLSAQGPGRWPAGRQCPEPGRAQN